ncbi:MAG: hypothetical protein ACP5F8_02065 [Candidatus Aenigmatarchaeota archaeon]|jgi:hypothetical protein
MNFEISKLRNTYIIKIFESHYCKIVFITLFLISYFLIPKSVFNGIYLPISVVYMILFALTMTCIVRNIKERIIIARKYQKSLVGLIASIIGLTSLQFCGVGSSACTITVGYGIISIIFPSFIVDFMEKYAFQTLIFSIILQIISLYLMKCFVEINKPKFVQISSLK